MFARKVSMHLKNDGARHSSKRLKVTIISFLRKQKGWSTKSPFYTPAKGSSCFSLWETAEHAEAYNRGTYPEVTKILASVVEGTPAGADVRSPQFNDQRTVAAVAA